MLTLVGKFLWYKQSLGFCILPIVPFTQRNAEVHAACCAPDRGADCSQGVPSTCDATCAEVLLPYWDDCEAALGATASAFENVVRECQEAAVDREGASLAMQLMLTCTDGTATEACVPECTADLHGDLLLANIDGEDSKYSCELHHGQ